MNDDTIIDNGMGLTLQAELEQTLASCIAGAYLKGKNKDVQKFNTIEFTVEQIAEDATKAILATVSKHLPEKMTEETPNGVYKMYGFNTAITEMEKLLGGNV